MARPREFNEDDVLDQACEVFWCQGYEASSLPDLLDATGLSRGSLYKAFGSKHELYLKSLSRYAQEGRRILARTLNESPSVKSGLRDLLRLMAENATREGPRRGCFVINSAVEMGNRDARVRELLRAHERANEEAIASALRRGIASGEIGKHVTPEAFAKTLTLVIAGLQVGGKSTLTRTEAYRTIESVLKLLD